MLDYFPFRIDYIQSDNSTEFTYRKYSFDTQHPLDIFCKKNILRVALLWYCRRHAQRWSSGEYT